MSEKFYEAFERFSIMSLQSDVGDKKALEYIEEKYGKNIADEIRRVI